jgi:hypothetical protein
MDLRTSNLRPAASYSLTPLGRSCTSIVDGGATPE